MSIPSLRQQMINEALDYHMNMNHVVFNRERKHVETMGQQVLDKKQSDIIIEGNIRDRISRIMTAIQKLVQGVDFAVSDPTKTPTATATATASIVSQPSVTGLKTSMGTQTEPELQSGVDKTTVAGSPLRSKKYINDAIASILSEYNSLCDYIDLQGRQKPFSQSDIAGIDGLIKQLIDPLKSAIAALSGLFSGKEEVAEYIEYTRLYNVITSIISKINIGFPFQKVDVSLLSDKVPLRKELIENATFDPFKEGNYKYMDTIYKQLSIEQEKLNNLPQHSQEERDAFMMASRVYERQRQRLSEAGYLTKQQYIDTALSSPLVDKFFEHVADVNQIYSRLDHDFNTVGNQFRDMLPEDSIQTIIDVIRDYDDTLIDAYKAIPRSYKKIPPHAIASMVIKIEQMQIQRRELLNFLISAYNKAFRPPVALTRENMENTYGVYQEAPEPSPSVLNKLVDVTKERKDIIDERSGEKPKPRTRVEIGTPYGEYKSKTAINALKSKPDNVKRAELANYIITNMPGRMLTLGNQGNRQVTFDSDEGRRIIPLQSLDWLKRIVGATPARKAIIGEGKPKKGGHVHKTEVFDDQAELEPYLTKHLIPSKYRKNVPPIESSSEESSGEEGDGSDMEINDLRLGKGRKKKGTRKQRKQMQDMKAISKLPVVEATVLIEKKRGGAKKLLAPIHKPVIKDSGADKDLWFL